MNFERLKSRLKRFYAIFIAPPKQWRMPKKSEILIYDAAGAEVLTAYMTEFSVEIIPLRGESVNVSCLLRAILKLSFWKGKVIQAYTEAFIQAVSPKVVVTFIDNNADFYTISKRFPGIKTIFLQNGTRGEVGDIFGVLVKSEDYHVDYMLVHGAAIGRLYQQFVSGEVIAVGSLKNNLIEKSAVEDGSILFISQYRKQPENNSPMLIRGDGLPVYWNEFYAPEVQALSFLSKWCTEHNKLLRISGCSVDKQGPEFDFYAASLKGCKWEYIPKSGAYSSYKLVDSAEIVVFIDSTLGYEAIGRGKKTASFACRAASLNSEAANFGWPADLPDHGPFWTNEANESEFRRIMDYLARVSDEEWETVQRQYTSEVMAYDSGNTRFNALLDLLLPKSASNPEAVN